MGGVVLTMLLMTGLVPQIPVARAAAPMTLYVDNGSGSDDNSCRSASDACQTIEGALGKAAAGAVIILAPDLYAGGITLDRNVTLEAGGGRPVLFGPDGSPTVTVSKGTSVTIEGLQLSHVSGASGSGIQNEGTLILTNSTVSNNTDSGNGGGIWNRGTVTLTNSTVSNNSAGAGGGIFNDTEATVTVSGSAVTDNGATLSGGGITNLASLRLTNSTISHNTTSQEGGGIENDGTLTVTDSTISGNSAGFGSGGIYSWAIVLLSNSLLAGNKTSNGHSDCAGSAQGAFQDGPGGHNLIGQADANGCGLTNGQHGDLVGTFSSPRDPKLGPLTPNGGPTLTQALLPGSPAIGAGDPTTCLATAADGDQRGAPRHAALRQSCDIGAFDTGGLLYVDATSKTPVSSCDGNRPAHPFPTLSAALACATSGDVIEIAGAAGAVYTGGLTLQGHLTLIGTGSTPAVIAGGSPVLTIAPGAQITLTRLVIQGGGSFTALGGGILNQGTLTLQRSTVRNNRAIAGGGIENAGDLLIQQSTLSGNTAYSMSPGGGALDSTGGRVTIVNSTLAGNHADRGPGGAVTLEGGTLTLHNSTISQNRAGKGGGGIAVAGGQALLTNTLLAGNSGPQPDCIGTLSDDGAGHNLLGNSSGCQGLSRSRDQVGSAAKQIDPHLGPLAGNGGDTQTMALLTGSPAINRGDNATCTSTGLTGVNNQDQRGDTRITKTDPVCDIGAYEYSAR